MALTGFALVLAFTVIASCSRAPETEATSELAVPEFQLASLDGGTLGPSDYDGKVVVFDFWATWCMPCHLQADILKNLYREFDGQGVQFVAVSVGEPESTVREFVDRRPFPYPVLVDPTDEVSSQLGIYGLPTIMVVDERGEVAYLRTGISPEGVLRELLEGLRSRVAASAG